MHDRAAFLRAFIDNPFSVGAFIPSSTAAAEAMASDIHPNRDSIVLEIGCGTGAFTTAIESILPSTDAFLGIEIDSNLIAVLRERFPLLTFVKGDACNAYNIHKKTGLGKVGSILCGLPFTSLPKSVCENVLQEVDKFMMQGDCLFRAIQYSAAYYTPSATKFRRRMSARYGKAECSRLVWRNIPPAYTLTWRT